VFNEEESDVQRYHGFLLLLLALAPGFAVAANPTSELKSADENWSKASEAKNLDQFMSFVADDVYDSGPDGKWTQGKAAIRDRWSRMLTDPGFKLTWTVDAADVSKDGRIGYTRGTFQSSMGGKPMAGSYATVWEKGKDGKWRAVVTIASGA
jgi:ketosteroid isomerase-like protein